MSFQYLIDSARPDPLRHYCERCDSCHESIDCAPLTNSVPVDGLAALDAEPAGGVRSGRRLVHGSTAARVKAHRASKARLDVLVKPEIAATLDDLAQALDCSKNELINSMLRVALTNRNWKQLGVYGARAAS
jgi:hypothetical protein